jgi:hypothetical protein
MDHEVTLFASLSAHTDSGQSMGEGLAALMALLALALPLIVVIVACVVPRDDAPRELTPARGGAPPPAPWNQGPPAFAPPTVL